MKSERAATLLALAYLAYPWIAWAAVDVFHPVVLAIPLLLFCVWFLDTGRLTGFATCAVLALATGELMGLPIAALGIWYAVARGKRAVGLAIAALGAGWTLMALYVVVPTFSGESSRFYGAFAEVGGSPWGLIETAFTDPGTILSAVSRGNDILYVLTLAAPLGAAFLLAPGLAAVALPLLAVNLLSGLSAMTYPHLHYVAGIVPFLFAAITIGLERLSLPGRVRGAFLVLAFSLAATLATGPWPGPLGSTPSWYWADFSPQHVQALRRAVSLVPDGSPVGSTNSVGSQLAARRYLSSVPVVGRAEWIVLDSSDDWIPRHIGASSDRPALRAFQERIQQSPEWRKVFERDGVFVFRKAQA